MAVLVGQLKNARARGFRKFRALYRRDGHILQEVDLAYSPRDLSSLARRELERHSSQNQSVKDVTIVCGN